MEAITAAVHELAALSIHVLSPADPRIVAQQGEFLFVASDRVRSVRLVQDRHLESISAANFLWLVCPDGYVGQSASMEVGYAAASGVPIFAAQPPTDLTLRQYVTIVPTIGEVLRRLASTSQLRHTNGILIDPGGSIENVQVMLERVKDMLTRPSCHEDPSRVYDDIAVIRSCLRLPAPLQ
jgi:hypothetical protein